MYLNEKYLRQYFKNINYHTYYIYLRINIVLKTAYIFIINKKILTIQLSYDTIFSIPNQYNRLILVNLYKN